MENGKPSREVEHLRADMKDICESLLTGLQRLGGRYQEGVESPSPEQMEEHVP